MHWGRKSIPSSLKPRPTFSRAGRVDGTQTPVCADRRGDAQAHLTTVLGLQQSARITIMRIGTPIGDRAQRGPEAAHTTRPPPSLVGGSTLSPDRFAGSPVGCGKVIALVPRPTAARHQRSFPVLGQTRGARGVLTLARTDHPTRFWPVCSELVALEQNVALPNDVIGRSTARLRPPRSRPDHTGALSPMLLRARKCPLGLIHAAGSAESPWRRPRSPGRR